MAKFIRDGFQRHVIFQVFEDIILDSVNVNGIRRIFFVYAVPWKVVTKALRCLPHQEALLRYSNQRAFSASPAKEGWNASVWWRC